MRYQKKEEGSENVILTILKRFPGKIKFMLSAVKVPLNCVGVRWGI